MKNLLIFLGLFLGGILFIIYALNNPQASFALDLRLVYALYLAYMALTFYFLYKFIKNKP